MASNLSHGMKRVLAGVLSLLVVAGNMGLPANVREGGLFAKNAIVASAATYSGNIETSTTLQAGDILEPGAMYMADGKTYVLQANGYCTEEHGIYTQGTTNRTLDNLMELNVSRQSDTLGAIGRMPDCYYPYADGAKIDAWVVVSVQSDGNEPWQPQTITLKGYAEPGPFTVTYAANDATSGAVPTDSDSHDKSSEVTVLGNTGNLEKTGCTFVGWKDQSGNIYKAGDKFTITKNTTLSAVWAGPLVGTEVKTGDSIDLSGKYYSYSSVQPYTMGLENATLKRFVFYYGSWSFLFDDNENPAFMLNGDETPAPIGFKVVSGEGTSENPYSFALLYEQSASNDAITYLTATWNESTQKVVYTETTASTYTVVESDTTAWGEANKTTTYVVTADTTISSRITVNGTVNLILCDGATLTASQGIRVAEGNTLNIYAQSAGTGALTATGPNYNAGIGGNGERFSYTGETCGTVNIFGGTVNATGRQGGAGIGGGSGTTGGNGGNVTIYGGTVNATTQFAPGIGGGSGTTGGNGGTVYIYGGTVNTNSGQDGVGGIGGGWGGETFGGNGTITLGVGLALQNSTNNSTWTTVEASNGDYTRARYMRTVKPTVTSAPTPISGLTYSESELELVQEGTAENGTMQYALGTNATTAPTMGWGTEIPTETNAGTYYVWYKAINGSAASEAGCVTVKIKAQNSFTTLAVADSSLQYDGNPKNLLSTVPVAAEGTVQYKVDNGDWSATPPTATNVGNYTVSIKAPATDNYAEYIDRVVVSISKGHMTVNPPTAANPAYTGNRVDLLSTLPSIDKGNTTDSILYAVTGTDSYPSDSDFSAALPTETAVGNYIVWYKVAGNDNYNDYSNFIEASITKATPSITLANDSTYDGSAKPLISSITYAGGTRLYLCVKDANDTSMTWTRYNPNTMSLTDNSFKRTDAGTYYVYYYNDKIEPSTTTEGTLVGSVTIANGTITGVSATGYSMPYDGQAHGITLTGVPSGATVKYCSTENGTYTTNPITYTNATDGAQTVYYKVEKANYNTVSGSATVNISKAALTVTAKPKTITYGDAPANNGVEYSGFVNNETSAVLSGTLGYTYTYSQYGDVGNTYTITPSGLTSDNYDITFATGTLTVEKKEIGITWGNTSFTYDGGSHIPTASATGTVNGDVIEITVDGSQTAAGTNYTATASALTGTKAGNYTLPSANTTNFTISNASLEGYSVQDYTGTYDGGAHGITVSASGATITYKKEDDADYSATNPQFINAGTYTVYYKISKANYNDVTGSATVQINPKSVTITGLSASDKVYDGTTSATPTGTATVSGKVGTDDVSVSAGTAAFADANVGTGKTVTFTGYTLSGAKANNYTLSAQPSATANITQAALTVTAKPKTITYGDAPANDGVEYSGFVTGDDASKLVGTLDYDYSYTQYENIGTYSITPKGLTSGNYNISFVADTLTVQAKTIGINWTNTTFTYNGESHIPTASATGTVNDDGIGITVIGGQTNASDTAYTATASALTGAKAGNYALPTANTQTFTISKANPTAVAPTGLTAIYGQTLADVTLTNPTGNTAGSWAWADTPTTSVGDYGTRTFAANFTPTDATNYNNATNVQVTVTVGKAVPTYEAPVLQGTRLTHYSSDLLLIKTPGSLTEGQGTMYYAVTENAAAPDADAVDTWKTDISDIKATKAGTYYVWYKITGADNYELAPTQLGSVTVSQYRAPSYYSQTWTLTMDSYEYDGTAHTPTINGTPQTYSNTQVRYTYYNTDTNEELDGAPSAVGNYKVEVYADGGSSYYSRTQEAEYSITAIDLSDAHIEITSDPFWADGTKKTVAYTVKLGDKTLVKGTDYTVSGDSATAAGDYTLTVTGKGIYKGTATASWSIGKLYNITVTNGTVNGKTSGKFTPNTVLAVKSNAPASGKKFGFWRRNGATVSYNTTYTFPLTSDVELEAVYLDADDEFDTTGNCVKDSVTIDKENSKITFSFMNTVPNGCSIVKAGIVATSDIQQANALAIGNAMYTKECTSTKHNFKYNWTKSAVTDGQAWYVKGYLIYKDASGEEHTVYSNMEKATLNGSETIWEDKVVGTALNYGTSVNKADKKITFSTFLNVPADCTITKAGLVATNVKADSKNLNTANAKFVKGEASTKHSVLYNWTKKNVGANETWYVRPYLVYIDALGMEQTVYGDVTSATLNG